jgi:hypothetical protein
LKSKIANQKSEIKDSLILSILSIPVNSYFYYMTLRDKTATTVLDEEAFCFEKV